MRYQGLIHKYHSILPVSSKTPRISLCEGNTPLIAAPNLSSFLGKGIKVWLKYEGLNPTGSFKDRGMTMAVSKAVEEGSHAVLCASTGNTSASAAAYAARAGIECVVLIPEGKIAYGKLAQAVMHGAKVFAIDGNFDQALNLAREISQDYPITLVNSVNPYRIEGQKTASYEILEQLGTVPDFHSMPVGNAGNITAYWKGYQEIRTCKLASKTPIMLGFQAAGAAPIVKGRPVAKPHTIATAIRIGNPASWQQALAARNESRGLIQSVTDTRILEAYRTLAAREGVFCEPASAASVAGIIQTAKQGLFKNYLRKSKRKSLDIVCVLTGHGLKDPDQAIKQSKKPRAVKANLKSLLSALRLKPKF
jgi:threonine synthase